ncbi:MAG: hypothetical protein JSR44_16500 [Spirochaetes bacterium]|nr:hypothetical protein [Spirochaetota bacterium]
MKINVYWPVEVYDQVHAVAAALRVSVSHLIWLILNLLSNGVQLPTQKFSNYVFSLIEWSENSMTFGETLQFRHQPPDI